MNSRKHTKRLRVFAGPNGSGKTTIIREISDVKTSAGRKIPLGVYLNADDIEAELRKNAFIHFAEFKVQVKPSEFLHFFREHPLCSKTSVAEKYITIHRNKLFVSGKPGKIDSYFASVITDFLRGKLLEEELSFSFETVMSHRGKIELMKEARKRGYRVYLYFVATEDPLINIGRVNQRHELGGHPVSEDKIVSRYYRSLDLLIDAIKASHRAYIFDNSGHSYELVAEVTSGKRVEVKNKNKEVPGWFYKYIYEKSKA